MSNQQPQAQLSLFPSRSSSRPPPVSRNTTPNPRRSESRERRAATPQEVRAGTPQQNGLGINMEPQPVATSGRQTPQQHRQQRQQPPPVEYDSPRQVGHDHQAPSWPLGGTQQDGREQVHPQGPQVQQPVPASDAPVRTDTGFSEAQTLVRANSVRSRSSIAKLPLEDSPSSASHQHQPLRSIFPTYNPDVPLNQQDYQPTQLSPTRIPRAVISRQTYHNGQLDDDDEDNVQSPELPSPSRTAASPVPNRQWPPKRIQEAPTIPAPCSTEQLKSLWRVANGWKASASEGRVYCMRLSQDKNAPIYTLSSSTQPFYQLRMNPTSTSAHVALTRHDPSKPFKAPSKRGSSSTSLTVDGRSWHDALTTTLEEESRRHPPNDGLVAELMPSPANKMATAKKDDIGLVMMAEREGARLVWDEDTSTHFLVHETLATPFCVSIERSPAWSRVEYTLEHHESPQHLAKLTRDGSGGGWLELDTGIASQIGAFYIVDVAVAALLLVAADDEKNNPDVAMEAFEPPPAPPKPASLASGRRSKQSSHSGNAMAMGRKKLQRGKMQEFEIDLESQSQDESLGKDDKVKEGLDKLPFVIRAPLKLLKALFKCFIGVLTLIYKCFTVVFRCCYSCVGSKY